MHSGKSEMKWVWDLSVGVEEPHAKVVNLEELGNHGDSEVVPRSLRTA